MDLMSESSRSPLLKVVLFSGGRGTEVLSRELINADRIRLTLAINGYDDGASTGQIRRVFGDMLGPSDFRKNASRLASILKSCPREHIKFLDLRLPASCTQEEAKSILSYAIGPRNRAPSTSFEYLLADLSIDASFCCSMARYLDDFDHYLQTISHQFDWSDCSIGNLIFAGCFIEAHRNFNAALATYCSLLNLSTELILNVTTGTDAHLVATDECGGIVRSEAEIVDDSQRHHIRDIYLIGRPLKDIECANLSAMDGDEIEAFFSERAAQLSPNPLLLSRLSEADLIVFGPGTQHSSLFPSYITPGVGDAIARNVRSIKLLITNIKEDAEITASSAVELTDRAVYYLRNKGSLPYPRPAFITHYLINDPGKRDEEQPYVPLGRLETLDDPRMVRIANYEDGKTGHHNALSVLAPFIATALKRQRDYQRIAVLMMGTSSIDKIYQSITELERCKNQLSKQSLEIFYSSDSELPAQFTDHLSFPLGRVDKLQTLINSESAFGVGPHPFDYVILFDSSGAYRGEEIVNLASLLTSDRFDAIWGSRRLSIRDVHQSYRRRYRHRMLSGAVSYAGSHLLSFAYLLLYGRYITDTLSGVRAIRVSYLQSIPLGLNYQSYNQYLLSSLLGDQAEIFETPVQFYPSPEIDVGLFDGLRALFTIIMGRFQSIIVRCDSRGKL